MNNPKILVVEDDSTVRNLITTTLKSNNYTYITAANGESAIAAATTQQPDIVFLDLGLPDLDGVEVIKRIRFLVPDARYRHFCPERGCG